MLAVWFGTVVLWSVVEQKKRGKREKPGGDQNSGDQRRRGTYRPLKHEETQNINVYIPDDHIESEEVKRKIKYIKEKHQPGLREDYGKGLLQVFDIAKLVVTPPHIPWDNDE